MTNATNFADFFAVNAQVQRDLRAFGRGAADRRDRARTEASSSKWRRAVSLAWTCSGRVEFANELAQEVRSAFDSVRAFHGTFEAAANANHHLRYRLATAVSVLADVARELRIRFPALAREVLA